MKDELEVTFLLLYSLKINPIEHFRKYMQDWLAHGHFHLKFENLVVNLYPFLVKHEIFNAEVLSK